MINIYNENRLTRQPFFKALIEYLWRRENEGETVKLRQIHHDFAAVKNLDRQLENYISAGWILRADKRYRLAFKVFDDADFDLTVLSNLTEKPLQNIFEEAFFVKSDSQIAQLLDSSQVIQVLSNLTNDLKIISSSRYDLTTDTLANYFYKVKENLPLSGLEQEIYQLIGDVDPNYALKYMTTFLLKFTHKTRVKSRPDIFVTALEKYGYITRVTEQEFSSNLTLENSVKFDRKVFDDASAFIKAQVQQKQAVKNSLWLDE